MFLTTLLSGFSVAQQQKTDLANSNLKGKVSSVRVTTNSLSNNTGDDSKEIIVSDKYTSYSNKGNKLKTSIFKEGILFSYIIYNYDNQDIITSSKEYNADKSLYLTISYNCNDKGIITEAFHNRILQKAYDDDRFSIDVEYDKYYQNLFTHAKFKSDFIGNILEERYFTQTGNLSFKILNKYDYKYNKVEVKYYNNSGKVSWRKKFKYDLAGNVIESKLFESNRLALVSKFEYEFDQNNNWKKRVETRKLYDNFFADNLNDNTLITVRKIEYY